MDKNTIRVVEAWIRTPSGLLRPVNGTPSGLLRPVNG